MNEMTTLSNVWDKVHEMARQCDDYMFHLSDIDFESIEKVNLSGKPHAVRPVAQRQICTRLGIPHAYLAKCPPELQKPHLDHWMKHERNPELFFRMDGDDVRAVFTPRYQPVDNADIVEKLANMGYKTECRVQVSLDAEFFSLSMPYPGKIFSVNGDKMQPGISIANSEVGLASLSISAFVLRLVCTNGLISKTQVQASYRHISQKVMNEFPQVMDRVGAEVGLQQARFKLSLESPVEDPSASLASFNRQFQLREPETQAVEWAWPMEAGNTLFHIINTYTKASQAPGISAESAFRLQRTGGAILGMVK